jgi:TonB family protein
VQPAPQVRVEPVYPDAARERGEQGWVELSYRIGPDGRVEAIAIENADANVAFERAAREALQQWRFDATDADGRQLRVRFDFVLKQGATAIAPEPTLASTPIQTADADARCKPRTGTRLCAGLRDGVREVRIMRPDAVQAGTPPGLSPR